MGAIATYVCMYVLCICLHDSDFMHYITFGFQFNTNQIAIYLNKKKI